MVISGRLLPAILTCKNICVRLVPVGGRIQNPYQKGLRYCRRCEVYLKCENSHCPCCGLHLRFTPVDPLAKEKLRRLLLKGE